MNCCAIENILCVMCPQQKMTLLLSRSIILQNLSGVKPSLFHDDLFQLINQKTLYVLMIQSIEFHFSVPQSEQYLQIGDILLVRLPSSMRKVKLEKCSGITADGICNYIQVSWNCVYFGLCRKVA